MKTWADLHYKEHEDVNAKNALYEKYKWRIGFDEVVYRKTRTKPREFDEQAVLDSPERWKKRVAQVVPPTQYRMIQKILGLPPLEEEYTDVERKYSLYDYVPQKSRKTRRSRSSGLSISEDTSSSFMMLQTRSKDESLRKPSSELFKVEYSRPDLVERPDSPRRKLGRLIKWKLAYLKARQKGDVEFDDLKVHPPTPPPTPPKDLLEDRRSPYQKFLTKTDEEVASTWRPPKGPKCIANMSLEERGEAASEEVAKGFLSWVRDKAGFTECDLTEAVLKDMFRIDLAHRALQCMKVEIKEMASVPAPIAKMYEVPEMSERAAMHRQIIWDSYYEKLPERKVCFGSSHPNRHKKFNKDTKAAWFSSEIIPDSLLSGEILWRDLCGTEILDKFCQWLLENPNYARPDYLIKTGYLNKVARKLDPKGEVTSFLPLNADLRRKTRSMNKNRLWERIIELDYKSPKLFKNEETILKDNNQGFTYIHYGFDTPGLEGRQFRYELRRKKGEYGRTKRGRE
ncbi:hypothetical protein O3M35_007986 [Rhynocoris fuscipes]|uniref:Uncharacterized protein n=1 Tax=Rhynocoris fuscipes TaxID=488301 RepID=A0AAW1DDY3_9HEMI